MTPSDQIQTEVPQEDQWENGPHYRTPTMKHTLESICNDMWEWKHPMLQRTSQASRCLTDISRWCVINDVQAYLCGGAIRDVVVKGPRAEIKDFDVMIDSNSDDHILQMSKDLGYGLLRDTLLGGLKVSTPRGTVVDLWQLHESYGIPHPDLEGYLVSVPTNIESVAWDLKTGKIHEEGFLKAINTRTVAPMRNNIPRHPHWLNHRIEYLQQKAGFTAS